MSFSFKIISDLIAIINSIEEVEKEPKASASIMDIENTKIKIKCSYWFKTSDVSAPGGSLRSQILIKTIQYLKDNQIKLFDEKKVENLAPNQNN